MNLSSTQRSRTLGKTRPKDGLRVLGIKAAGIETGMINMIDTIVVGDRKKGHLTTDVRIMTEGGILTIDITDQSINPTVRYPRDPVRPL